MNIEVYKIIIVVVIGSILVPVVWRLISMHFKVKDLEPLRKHVAAIVNLADLVKDIHNHIFKNVFIASESPISLTENGKKLAQELDFATLSNQYLSKMRNQTKEKNAYQIQEYCLDFSEKKLLDELEENDKDFF